VNGQRNTLTLLLPVKGPVTHNTKDWVGSRACLDGHREKKIICLRRNSNGEPSSL